MRSLLQRKRDARLIAFFFAIVGAVVAGWGAVRVLDGMQARFVDVHFSHVWMDRTLRPVGRHSATSQMIARYENDSARADFFWPDQDELEQLASQCSEKALRVWIPASDDGKRWPRALWWDGCAHRTRNRGLTLFGGMWVGIGLAALVAGILGRR